MTSPDTLVGTPRQLGDFSEWGTELLVPFEVRELKFASVLWLNERWFKTQNKIHLNGGGNPPAH